MTSALDHVLGDDPGDVSASYYGTDDVASLQTLVAPPDPPAAAQPGGSLVVGEILSGTYKIRELLGRGAMGEVYEADDLLLARRVAIKVAIGGARSMLQEAQAQAAIRHPSMVTIHALGRHEGREYLVMERLYGVPLDAHLRQLRDARQRFTVTEAVEVLIGIADGLAAVHRAGVAHRDVKPANIMLAPANRVVLMDLGLFQPEASAMGQLGGTPWYMAPEAIKRGIVPGQAHLVDVYALGIVAFEILTGRVPFDSPDVARALKQQLHDPVPSLEALRPDLTPGLVDLVMECLAKSPHERPQSAEAVAWQLRHVLQRNPASRVRGQFTVLVVDDDDNARSFLGAAVERAHPDTQLRFAGTAKDALRIIREQVPDLMLVDIELPDMNGIAFCAYLRGTHLADTCTMASVSGTAVERDIEVLRQLGVAHFLPKTAGLAERVVQLVQGVARLQGRC